MNNTSQYKNSYYSSMVNVYHYRSHFHIYLISIRHWKFVSLQHEVSHYAKLLLKHYDVGKRYHITMSLQCQYTICLHRDENLTKNRCRQQYRELTGYGLHKKFLGNTGEGAQFSNFTFHLKFLQPQIWLKFLDNYFTYCRNHFWNPP